MLNGRYFISDGEGFITYLCKNQNNKVKTQLVVDGINGNIWVPYQVIKNKTCGDGSLDMRTSQNTQLRDLHRGY